MKMLITVAGMLMIGTLMYSQSVITVNPATEYQTILGLGGHGYSTDANYNKYLIDLMGLSGYRHWVESEDTSKYVTLADITNGTIPFRDLNANAIASFATMKAKGVNFVIATNWSPPACLKNNNCVQQRVPATVGGPLICGQACVMPVCQYNYPDTGNYLSIDHYDEYARYMQLWAKDFQTKTGMTLYAISIQNEPLFNEPYNSALLYSYRYGACLKAVHDTFAKYPALSSIKFFGPEHMGSYGRNSGGDGTGSKYVQDLLWNATYRPYLDVFAVHSYTDGIAFDLGSAPGWSALDTCARKWGKDLWMTETDFGGDATDWPNTSFALAKSMFTALKYGKVNTWLHWSMQTFYKSGGPTKYLYTAMQFMRFIRPGYIMVDVAETDPDVVAAAFKNPAGTNYSVIVINTNTTKEKTVTFGDFTNKPAFFHVYRSSALESCSYLGKVTNNQFVLPALSVVTLTYDAAAPDVVYGAAPPTNLRTTNVSDNSITVAWNAAAGWVLKTPPTNSTVTISGYIVYIDGIKKTPSGPITSLNYTFTGLKPGTAHKIEIYTRDALYGQSAAAVLYDTTTCTAGDCVPGPGLKDNNEAVLNISPNPANSLVTVAMPDDEISQISIVDIAGTVMIQKNVQSVSSEIIDVSGLSKGLYVVIAKGKKQAYKAKLIIE